MYKNCICGGCMQILSKLIIYFIPINVVWNGNVYWKIGG